MGKGLRSIFLFYVLFMDCGIRDSFSILNDGKFLDWKNVPLKPFLRKFL